MAVNFDLRAAQHDLGLLLHVPAAAAALPGIAAAVRGEHHELAGFAFTIALSIAAGQLLIRTARRPAHGRAALSMPTAALAWLACALVASIPFAAAGLDPAATHSTRAFAFYPAALFEAMSGITSTGLSMAADPSALPASIQLWRSILEWIGGLGLVLVALAVFQPTTDPYALYTAEARTHSFGPHLRATVHCIWISYATLTLLSILALRLTGWSWWIALNHGITAISTGGFTITPDSYASAPPGARPVAVLFMILGAIGFNVHDGIRQGQVTILLRDVQTRFLLATLLLGGTLLLAFTTAAAPDRPAPLDAAFNWISASTTCGFSAIDPNAMGDGALLLLIMAMLAGGAAGSTAGGLKMKRVWMLTHGIAVRIRFELHQRPSFAARSSEAERAEREREEEEQEQQLEQEERALEKQHKAEDVGQLEPASAEFHTAGILLLLFLGAIAAGTLALLATVGERYTLGQCLFDATSALCSVGLSTGVAGPDLPWPATVTLIILMWIGRLEILAVLALIASIFSRNQT